MSEMLRPESILTFGKYKGKSVANVFADNPAYFYWLRETGFMYLGKEITEALFVWEDENPGEAAKTKRSAERKKIEEAATAPKFEIHAAVADAGVDISPLHDPLPPPVISKSAPAAWGSW